MAGELKRKTNNLEMDNLKEELNSNNIIEEMKNINTDIEKIKDRNKKVELDKAWETSFARKIIIAILTYFVIVIFFYFSDLPRPFINSIVPALAFVLSTLSLPYFKRTWIKHKKKHTE